MHTTPALTTTTPIVLFAHGSRDPRWAQTLDHLQTALEQQAAAQGRTCVVRQAFLELMEPPLPQVLAQLGAEGATQVAVLPVFWSAGSHVLGDLPALIAQAQADYPQLQVQTWPVLSRWPGLLDWLAGQALAQLGYDRAQALELLRQDLQQERVKRIARAHFGCESARNTQLKLF